jgi:hypothetical protein
MFPTIKDLASHLAHIKRAYFPSNDWEEMDVRLQVRGDGWQVNTGDSQYDQDHRGFWGAGTMDKRTNCHRLAKDLIDQAREGQQQEIHYIDSNMY